VTGAAPETIALPDAEATEALGRQIAAALRPGDLVLIEGTLGAGKTTLVRGLVAALGGDPAQVYSVASGPIARLHHADLYRLRGMAAAPLDEVGLGDALADGSAVTAIEWPESWPWLGDLAGRVLRVRLEVAGDSRTATVAWG
jgi:tRNA threonylcarbamoyl adenosine modification protein YjeE